MTEQNNQQQPEFDIQRIYVKDLSFETNNTPHIFREEWKPELNLELNTSTEKLADDVMEVILTITVTVKNGEKDAFVVEVQQAGIFTMKGFPEDQLGHMLGSYCPTILYPYAREVISDVINRGSFPQLLLTPVNFDALYAQHLESEKQQQAANETK